MASTVMKIFLYSWNNTREEEPKVEIVINHLYGKLLADKTVVREVGSGGYKEMSSIFADQ